MPYPTPELQFDALEHARNKILRANQFQEMVIQQYRSAYDDFWGVSEAGGSRYSVAQMQAVLDAMPQATAQDILQDSASFNSYIQSAYPDALPEKYRNTAFEYTLGPNGITVTGLRDAWMVPAPKEEENAVVTE